MLLTYNEYNRDLGYVQGMSDLLAPIYAVMQDDALAFWGFVKFMERMERNFLRDQSGMRTQLLTLDQLVQLMDPALYLHLQKADSTNFFFFFRMLLVWYKREFEWADTLRLWESLWTDYLSSNFHLFIALAILEKHREVIMEHLKHFDEVLKYSKSSWTPFPLTSRICSSSITESLLEWKSCFSDCFSQRTLEHNRPPLDPPPHSSSLPPHPTHLRSYRQEDQFSSPQHSTTQTRSTARRPSAAADNFTTLVDPTATEIQRSWKETCCCGYRL